MMYHIALIDDCAIFVDFIVDEIFPAVVVHVKSVLHFRRSWRTSHTVFSGQVWRESERKSNQQDWRTNSQQSHQIVSRERCFLHLKFKRYNELVFIMTLRLVIRCEKFCNFFSERCNFRLEIAKNLKLCIHKVLLTTSVPAKFQTFFNNYFKSYKSLLWRTQNFAFPIFEKLNE